MTKRVTIYTDGGCDPNPGPGGYGVVILEEGQAERELCGGAPDTTNNRMEMTAALEAFRALAEPCEVHLWTDSQYLKNGITKWLAQWRARGWMTRGKEPVKNQDLWEALDLEIPRHKVHWHWTRGHSGDRWNERADQLATMGIRIGRRGETTATIEPRPDAPTGTASSPGSTAPAADPERSDDGADDSPALAPTDDLLRAFVAVSFSGKDESGALAVIFRFRDYERTITKRLDKESANRLHLHSAIVALETLKRPMAIHIYTASDYVKDGVTKWIAGWRSRGWRTKENADVSNRDLWEKLDELARTHDVKWHSVGKEGATPPEMGLAKQLAHDARVTSIS